MRAAHRRGDARRDLVAHDHRAQKRLARCAAGLSEGERGGDGGRARVIDAVAEDVVHLDRMRGRAVDERRRAHRGAPAQGEPGFAAVELFGERALERSGGRDHGAGKERRVPIDHRAFCVVQQLRRGPPRAKALRKSGEPLHRVHRVGPCAGGRDAPVADPAHFLSSTSGLITLIGLPAR